MEAIVTGQSNETSPRCGEGEENLYCSVFPYSGILELLPLNLQEVEANAFHVSGQGEAPDEQDDEDDVGEDGGEVDDLA